MDRALQNLHMALCPIAVQSLYIHRVEVDWLLYICEPWASKRSRDTYFITDSLHSSMEHDINHDFTQCHKTQPASFMTHGTLLAASHSMILSDFSILWTLFFLPKFMLYFTVVLCSHEQQLHTLYTWTTATHFTHLNKRTQICKSIPSSKIHSVMENTVCFD